MLQPLNVGEVLGACEGRKREDEERGSQRGHHGRVGRHGAWAQIPERSPISARVCSSSTAVAGKPLSF